MKKRLILYILGVLIFIVIVVGITYAFMKPKVEEKEGKSNITINACAKIQLKENGNSINLKNTYPMADEMGLNTQPYEFTISSTCAEYVGFNLYLTSLNSNGIEDDKIHYAITNKNKDILKEGILASQENGKTDFNNEELKELNIGIKGEPKNIYKVYSNNIPLNDESTYQLYLWVDKEAGNEVMGKNFQVGLSVKSYNRKETFAEYLIKNKDETLIYHNGICDYEGEENCDLEADDSNYRYAGASNIINNYVCLDGTTTSGKCTSEEDLYRIIGLFKNENAIYEAKLIKSTIAIKDQLGDESVIGGAYTGTDNLYAWNSSLSNAIPPAKDYINSNMWKDSNLNKVNLNKNFYDYLIRKNSNLEMLIPNHNWIVGGIVVPGNAKKIFEEELGKNKPTITSNVCYTQTNLPLEDKDKRLCNQANDLTYTSKIGLMYKSDYMYAATSNNWTNMYDNYEKKK